MDKPVRQSSFYLQALLACARGEKVLPPDLVAGMKRVRPRISEVDRPALVMWSRCLHPLSSSKHARTIVNASQSWIGVRAVPTCTQIRRGCIRYRR